MKTYTIENETNNITKYVTVRDAELMVNSEHFRNEAGLTKLAAKWPASRLVETFNNLPGVTQVKRFTDRQTGVARIWKAIQYLDEAAGASEPTHLEPIPAPPTAPRPAGAPFEDVPAPGLADEAAPTPQSAPFESALAPATAGEAFSEPGVAQTDAVIAEPRALLEAATPAAEPETVAAVGTQEAEVGTATAPTSKAKWETKTPRGELKGKAKTAREGSKTDMILHLLKRPGGASLDELTEVTHWQKHSVRGFLSGTLSKKMGLTVVSAKSERGARTYSINA